MSVLWANTTGADHDASTAASFWQTWNGTIALDTQIGYYITANGDVNFPAGCCSAGFQTSPGVYPAEIIFAGYFNFAIGNTFKIFQSGSTSAVQLAIQAGGTFWVNGYTSGVIPNLLNGWHYYEFKFTAGMGTGAVNIRMDGALVWSINSITIALSNFATLSLGAGLRCGSLLVLDTLGAAPYNDFLGELQCTVLFPTADVGIPEWHNDFGGANYAQVNSRIPPGDAHFIHSPNTGDTDVYTTGPLPVDTAWIAFVMGGLNARKNAGIARTVGFVLDNGTTQHVGADLLVQSGQYNQLTELYVHSPFTGVQWALSEFNTGSGVRIGQTVKA